MTGKNGLLTIGQVAREAGIAATTLRYYERQGILQPSDRSGTGYRLYGATAVDRLKFIRSAQAVGFTLEDIRTLLDLDREGTKHCKADVQRLLAQRLAEVERKMKELKRVRAALGQALDRCRDSNGECPVLSQLRPGKKQGR